MSNTRGAERAQRPQCHSSESWNLRKAKVFKFRETPAYAGVTGLCLGVYHE